MLLLLEKITLCVLLWHSVFLLCSGALHLTQMGEACRWVSISELLDDEVFARGSLGNTRIVTSIHVPAIKPTNVFWSYKASLYIFEHHTPSLQRPLPFGHALLPPAPPGLAAPFKRVALSRPSAAACLFSLACCIP